MRVGLSAVALLALALFVASFVPSATLAGRLFGAAGEARSGVFARDLFEHLGDRLRFSGALFLALAAGLTITRSATLDLFSDAGCELARLGRTLTRLAALAGLSQSERRILALVAVPTLVALAVRLPFIGQPIRYDEALTFNEFASRPLYYGLSFYPDPNNHVLNTLLMHVGYVVFGNQLWVIRLPAVVAGVLLVPATYALGCLLFGSGAGVLAAALVAVSSYLVEYSTNGRGYTLQALSFVVLLDLAIVSVRRDSRGWLLVAAVIAALGAYAVPTMLYGVAAVAVWLLIQVRRARLKRIRLAHLLSAGLTLGLVVVVLYLPVLIVSGPDKLATNRFVVPLTVGDLASELPRSLSSTFALWNRDVPLALAAVLVVGFVVGSWREPIGLVTAGTCLVLVVLQRVAPFERVWLFLLPLYFAVASGGLARFVDGRLLAIAFGAVLGFFTLNSGSILSSTETGVFPDAEAVTRSLATRLAAGDAVLTTLPASLPELQYYFPRYGLPISTLVRPPDEANRLWVVTAAGDGPHLDEWTNQAEAVAFQSSTLFELER